MTAPEPRDSLRAQWETLIGELKEQVRTAWSVADDRMAALKRAEAEVERLRAERAERGRIGFAYLRAVNDKLVLEARLAAVAKICDEWNGQYIASDELIEEIRALADALRAPRRHDPRRRNGWTIRRQRRNDTRGGGNVRAWRDVDHTQRIYRIRLWAWGAEVSLGRRLYFVDRSAP